MTSSSNTESIKNGISTQTKNSSLRKVQCLACQKIVFPPVMQCKNWHLVCNNCRQTSIEKCPEPDCDEEIGAATRSGITENFLEKYIIRCKYFKEGSGCMEAVLKDDIELLPSHELICPLREVKCLVPTCYKSVRMNNLIDHFSFDHSMSPNSDASMILNVSEIIMNKKTIVNETCGERTYKSIPCFLKDEEDVFLAIFRITSLRSPICELSTVLYPYYAKSEAFIPIHTCIISALNEEDPNASYKWEGPLMQIYPLTPNLSVSDERAKLKWIIKIEIFRNV